MRLPYRREAEGSGHHRGFHQRGPVHLPQEVPETSSRDREDDRRSPRRVLRSLRAVLAPRNAPRWHDVDRRADGHGEVPDLGYGRGACEVHASALGMEIPTESTPLHPLRPL